MAKGERFRPAYRTNAEHAASTKAFAELPLNVQRKSDFRSFDTGFWMAHMRPPVATAEETELMWKRCIRKARAITTKKNRKGAGDSSR